MRTITYWTTPFAKHEVPPIIVWLANKANILAGYKAQVFTDPQSYEFFRADQPWFKVIAEWGAWREAEDMRMFEGPKPLDTEKV